MVNDRYVEATTRIYFNRLSNLVWHEYLKEYEKFGKGHNSAMPHWCANGILDKETLKIVLHGEMPEVECCMDNIFDLDTWANAKAPVTLMSEVICVKRNTDEDEVQRRKTVSVVLSHDDQQIPEETKAKLWVSNLHYYQNN